LKILHLNHSKTGGAWIAVTRLISGLQQLNVNANLLTYDEIRLSSIGNRISSSVRHRWNKYYTYRDLTDFSFWTAINGFSAEQILHYCNDVDIINIHWIGNMLDYKEIPKLSEHIPLVWTVHDRNPFTDSFHYLLESNRARKISIKASMIADRDKKIKSEIFKRINKNRLFFVSPSLAYQKEVKNSLGYEHLQIFHIPNAIDTKIYKPMKKEAKELKKKLNLSDTSKIVLFVAAEISNPYKGFETLIRALEKIPSQITCLVLGGGALKLSRHNIINVGFISDDVKKAEYYSVANVFVTPSLEESFGNTVIESMSCGTPVIASNIGGLPDMVRPGVTGELFSAGNSDSLAACIIKILDLNEIEIAQLSVNCREIAVKEYDILVQANAYKDLYEQIISDKGLNQKNDFL
jgi:glycosyltransferase involved in cell wall biosynthesis